MDNSRNKEKSYEIKVKVMALANEQKKSENERKNLSSDNNWFLLRFNATSFNGVFSYLKGKGINYLCPMSETLYKRPDCKNSFRKRMAPTFPGYLFVNMNFNNCHTTKITSHDKIYCFVKFGKDNQTKAIPEKIINELAANPIRKEEKSITHNNETPISKLEMIARIKNDDERISALLEYIMNE